MDDRDKHDTQKCAVSSKTRMAETFYTKNEKYPGFSSFSKKCPSLCHVCHSFLFFSRRNSI